MRIKKKNGTLFSFKNGTWELLMIYVKPPKERGCWVAPYLVLLAARVHPNELTERNKHIKFGDLDLRYPLKFYKIRQFEKVSRRDLPLFMDWQTGTQFERCMKGERIL